jgi:two-component system OmpR family response regulator
VKVLVVEDDPRMAGLLHRGLTRRGWIVTTSGTARAAQDEALAGGLDAIVCDVMLPDESGIELCRWLRRQNVWTPVLLLTARTAVSDRVAGLDAGADDYLGKPFAFDELEARLRALIRREPTDRPAVLSVGRLTLDPATHEVRVDDAEVDLSPKEFALLHLFMRRPGQLLTRTTILDHVWNYSFDARSNVIDVYIAYLRRKLAPYDAERYITTVRGQGYRLLADTE